MAKVFINLFRRKIHLTDERWRYITDKHPEVKRYFNKINDILINPDVIKRSKRDKHVTLYYKFYKDVYGGKYLLVIVRENERSFIITFFVTDKIKGGNIIWGKR